MPHFQSLLICLLALGIQHLAFALAPPALPRSVAAPSQSVRLWSSKSDDNIPPDARIEKSESFTDKISELDKAIAAAQKERQKLLRAELDRYEKNDDKLDLVPVEEWASKELKNPPPPMPIQSTPSFPTKTRKNNPTMSTRSKVSRSDAGTLVIEITPQGISSGMLFNGAFSVAWFSAIVPATVAAMSGGILTGLFLLPFWMAGGMVAKQAVVDPFVSNKLSIGQYAYSVESLYAKNQVKKQEGATENLQGARVEVPVVVNGVPQYQLVLYDRSKGVTNLGIGLPEEELEKVSDEINEYLENLQTLED